ncbi:MAG TPA: sodium:proton antiporter [Xanthobacteraceae bacterium]|nr:sodium:proton antiporter [Xanthobacteraceae bacterium]
MAAAGLYILLSSRAAFAAEGLDGATMSILWVLPFAGLLLSIATGPLFYPHVWEHHYGKFSAFWAACVIVPLYFTAGFAAATHALLHTALLEYMPFILLLLALFVVAGGVYLEGNLRGTPAANTVLLGVGTLLASVVGTTGASMILIRPLIRANDDRIYNVHVVIFFIFLVSNIGGSLTPLGDPPLFVGFLKGVDFFWTTTHLWKPMLIVAALLLVLFFVVDLVLHHREEGKAHPLDPTPDSPLRLHGLINFALLGVVIAAILMSAYWKSGVGFSIAGVRLELQNLLRDAIFVGVVFASLRLTNPQYRLANGFGWGPIQEVALLFAGIFMCIVPVIAILHAGSQGALAPLLALVSNPDGSANNAAYFWLTGGLSSFLDNAPTYLVFFELAGGDARTLMTVLAPTLVAISLGAVFMGANTYIGNAPNFMVYAIARERGVRMPSFFGYMLWSSVILLPIFLLCTWLFFH